MVISNPALFMSTGAHSAASFRRLTAAATFDGEGVVGVDDLAVTQTAGGANLGVTVAGGRAYVKGTEGTFQGTYFIDNQGGVDFTVPAPDNRLARIDLVSVRVQDQEQSGTESAADLHYQTGTPAATPAAPEANFNTLVLAEVRVAAAATAITNSEIVDLRSRAFTDAIEPFMIGSVDGADVVGNVVSATTALTANVASTATTAASLGTPRTIAISGDAVGSAVFDGSANIDIEVQASLTADDIPNLNADKITEGTIDAARLPSVTLATGPVQATTITASDDVNIGDDVLFVDVSQGFVGINHDNPGVALDVMGATWTSGLATFRGGLDIRGDVTVDTDTFFIDVANNRVGINTITPAVALDVDGGITATDVNVTAGLLVAGTSGLATTAISGALTVGTDHLTVNATNGRVGVGTTSPSATLTVDGTLTATGAVTMDAGLTVAGDDLVVDSVNSRVGVGRNPVHGFDVAGTSRFSGNATFDADVDITGALTASIGAGQVTSGTLATARVPNLNATKITAGTLSPARVPGLNASKINAGTLAIGRIPDLDASKITTGTIAPARLPTVTGTWSTSRTLTVSGDSTGTATFDGSADISLVLDAAALVAGDVPNLPASKISSGILGTGRIPNLDASKLTSGTIDAARLPPVTGTVNTATNLAGGTVNATTITGSSTLNVDSGVLYVDTTLNRVGINTTSPNSALTVTGDVTVTGHLVAASAGLGTLTATTVTASGAITGQIDAGQISSGTLPTSTIPGLQASTIVSGTLNVARIPNLSADKINSGTLNTARIPNLTASKITGGTLLTSTIPNLNADKITAGTLPAARIPGLSAAKITAGTFPASRIPSLPASKITGVFAVERIPGLPASTITSGVIDAARLPAQTGGGFTAGSALSASTITGTGDLTIGSNVLFVDESAGFVGINHDNPGVALDVDGASWTSGLATFRGDINADEGTLFVDASASRVGVGTVTPGVALDVVGALDVSANTRLAGRLSVAETANLNDVVANTLIVDNNTLHVDAVNNRVGFGTSTPNTTVGISGTLGVTSSGTISGDFRAGTGALTVIGSQDRVGINQEAPEQTLDVDGSGRFTGALQSRSFNATGNLTAAAVTTTGDVTAGNNLVATANLEVAGEARFGTLDAGQISTGTIDAARLPANIVSGGGFTPGSPLAASTITGTGNLDIDSGTLFVDTVLNRVGINDNTPEHSLDLNGTMAVRGASFFTGAAGFGRINASGNMNIDSGTLYVNVERNMVGVGTVSPAAKLHVAGTLVVDETTTMTQGLAVGGRDFVVNTATNRVGIGIRSPTSTLDVRGTIFAHDITVADNITVGNSLTAAGFNAVNGNITGVLTANDLTVGNSLTAAGFNAVNGNITGVLTANDLTVGNSLTAAGFNAVNGNITGVLTAEAFLRRDARSNVGMLQPRIWVQSSQPATTGPDVGDLWVTF